MNDKFRYSPSVYYTSLQESVDRREYMKKMLDSHGIAKHEAFVTERFEDLDLKVAGKYVGSLSDAEKGVTTTHLRNIRKWLETTNERYAMFCEDDISFDTVKYWTFTWEDFMLSLPSDWKIVQLLRINPFKSMDYEEPNGLKIRKRNWCDWGCHFIINRRAAQELIDRTCISENEFVLQPFDDLHPMPENVLYSHFQDYLDTVYSVPLFTENTSEFKTTFVGEPSGAKLDQYESSVYYMDLWKESGQTTSIDDMMLVNMPKWDYVVNRSRL